MGKERKLPYSTEAEQSVLGAMLIDSVAVDAIISQLTEEDFYIKSNQIIWIAMEGIYKKQNPIDFVTLTDELERNNQMESVGGVEYITLLTNFVPSASNYQFYVDIVKQHSLRRKYIAGANKILNAVLNEKQGDIETLVSGAEKTIFDIGQNQSQGDFTKAKNVTEEIMTKFNDAKNNHGKVNGIPTGFYSLDKLIKGLQKSDLILIAARPGFGKTSLAMNIVTNAAIKEKKHVALFSLEMSNQQLVQRMMCSVGFVDMEKAALGKLTPDEWKALWEAKELIDNASIELNDKSLNTTASMLSQCRRLKREKGLDLVVIDYLQLLQTKTRRENRQAEVSEISRDLKILAKELDVPVILLSQLSREVEKRTSHKPVLSDLRESGAIEQDADIVMFIHKPNMYDGSDPQPTSLAELIIAKHRNGPVGQTTIKWHGPTTTFMQTEKDTNLENLEKEGER